jgi:hypothetical protein
MGSNITSPVIDGTQGCLGRLGAAVSVKSALCVVPLVDLMPIADIFIPLHDLKLSAE